MINWNTTPDSQPIQVTFADLKRLIKEMQAPARRWVSTGEFKKLTGLTKGQIRGLKEKDESMFKWNNAGTRLEVDIQRYFKNK